MIYFATNEFVISEEHQVKHITNIANAIQAAPRDQDIVLLLLGFADHRGSHAENKTLSQNRANAVYGSLRGQLTSNPNVDYPPLGMGETPPPGFETNDLRGNRRVDIYGPPLKPAPPPVRPKELETYVGGRNFKARIVEAGMAGEAVVIGHLTLEIVDVDAGWSQQFVYKGVGLGAGTPISYATSSGWRGPEKDPATPLLLKDFTGFTTWAGDQIQIGLGPSIDRVIFYGPKDKGSQPLEFVFKGDPSWQGEAPPDFMGVGIGLAQTVGKAFRKGSSKPHGSGSGVDDYPD